LKPTLVYENGLIINATEWFIKDSSHSDYRIFLVNGSLPRGEMMVEQESPFPLRDHIIEAAAFFPKP